MVNHKPPAKTPAKLPPHGDVRRYRLELKDKKTCAKCRAANSAQVKARREARQTAADATNVTQIGDFAGRKKGRGDDTTARTSENVVKPRPGVVKPPATLSPQPENPEPTSQNDPESRAQSALAADDAADGATHDREKGRLEQSLADDLDAIPAGERVRMHATLREVALDVARELDQGIADWSVRSGARKQLFELVKLMQSGGSPDAPQSALDSYFDQNGIGGLPPGA